MLNIDAHDLLTILEYQQSRGEKITLNHLKNAIAKLKSQRAPLITRFAPSPTGYLHLGHLGHILYLWTIARAVQAQIILRMEDHDQTRCKPKYENAIFDDLKWLGLNWSNQSFQKGVQGSSFRQSDCLEMYAFQIQQLKNQNVIYPCCCSRKQLQDRLAQKPANAFNSELAYDGFCRDKNTTSKNAGLRLTLDRESIAFEDLLMGKLVQNPHEQCGDILIKDRNNNYTYQWAVTLDDLRHQINLVIRGQDLVASTGRQIQMQRILGENLPPHYLHHPILTDSAGLKLSKSTKATSIAERRAAGQSAEAVIGIAAHAFGITDNNSPISVGEVSNLILDKVHEA